MVCYRWYVVLCQRSGCYLFAEYSVEFVESFMSEKWSMLISNVNIGPFFGCWGQRGRNDREMLCWQFSLAN